MAARPRQISDDEILEVACACFLENGPSVSVQVIADRLGISQPALFKRFTTKENLMLAALIPTPDILPILPWLDIGPETGPFYPQLEKLISMLWKTINIVFPRVSVLSMSGIPREELQRRMKDIPLFSVMDGVALWIAKAQRGGYIRKGGDPVVWAQMCIGPLQGRAALKYVLRADVTVLKRPLYRNFQSDKLFIRATAEQLWRGMSDTETSIPK